MRYILLLLLMSAAMQSYGRHIVGGEIRMRSTSVANRFTFTLVQFWDENTLTSGNRDPSTELLVYRKRDNQLIQKISLPYVSSKNINYKNQACASFRSLNTLEGTYSAQALLRPADYSDAGGYYVVWERCCRNDDINNIQDPGSSGMVFYLEFPPLSIPNSTPEFSFPNGDYICKDQVFSMNVSATDVDGDELRYSLVTPLRGNTGRNNPIGDDFPKTGYPSVQWVTGISDRNMIPGNPALAVNPRSGLLTVTANQLGLYVFTVQCEEYRNGVRIGLVRRDFQLLVIECSKNTPPEPVITYNKVKADLLEFCPERPLILETESAANWSYQWQLNGLNIPGATNATLTVLDTGRYSVVKSFKTLCSKDTSSLLVKVIPGTLPQATIAPHKDSLCEGEKLDLVAPALASGYGYEWRSNKTGNLIGTSQTLNVDKQGTYWLLIRDEKNGCTAWDSTTVAVERVTVTIPAKMSLQRGNSIRLPSNVQSSATTISYSWSPSDGLTSPNDSMPSAAPLESQYYMLQVTSPLGCVALDSVWVEVLDRLYIPDAFSPNGDGINDVLTIYNGSDQIEDIRIINRWGEVIFQTGKYDTPWDGRYKENVVPEGAYIYIIKTSFYTYKGTIVVLH
jgi:gliding motility-associated-like protein